MRILMTTDTVGGVWTYTTELVLGLLERGCSVILITLGPRPGDSHRAWIEATLDRWPQTFQHVRGGYSLEWMEHGSGCYEASCGFLEQCIATYQPDLLHSNQFCYGALPARIPKLVVAHSDVRSWAANCSAPLAPSQWVDSYDHMVNQGLRGADAVVAPTDWMAKELARHYPLAGKVRVIHNGRSLPVVPSMQRRLQAVNCGRVWDRAKNVPILEHVSDVLPLLVAGDRHSPDGAIVESMPGVIFLGKLTQTEVLRLFAKSAMYIATSRYEPFGLAPVEAALCGCAIVANDIASLREVWGESANYYARDSAASLRQVLEYLRDCPGALKQAADRARTHAQALYGAERMTENYLRLYSDLCGQTVSSAA